MTVHVWIAQCLCPQRHCILAATAEANGEAEARATILWPLRDQVGSFIVGGTINPRCGICRSPAETWTYEIGRTRWASMADAAPEIRRLEREQAVTGLIWGELGGTRQFDA